MTHDEMIGWSAYDEMSSIFHSIRAADRNIPGAEIIRMVVEEQTANDWHGRVG